MWKNEGLVALAAAQAGARKLEAWIGKVQPTEKSIRDFVTQADIASQQAVFEILHQNFPNHALLGEEDAPHELHGKNIPSHPCWLVDPLDGTTNFLHQFPSYCVSVGLAIEGRVVAAAIVDPMLQQTYSAVEGGGAWCNGKAIHVGGCDQLRDALVAASLPANVQRPSRHLGEFIHVLTRARSVRRMGSCALNLCYLAQGRLDGYWADTVKMWDVAAGSLIAREAGVTLIHRAGGEFKLGDPRFIAAATPKLAEELRRELDRAEPI
jgi:myo-inositol-1(or 4)-monophosphatase